jgi:hypothetical protein
VELAHLGRADAVSVRRSLAVYFSLGALLYLGTRLVEREGEPPIRVVVREDATEAEIATAKREAVLVREAKRIGALAADPAMVQWIAETLPESQRTREDILAMLEMGLEDRDPVIRGRLVYWAERMLESQADSRVTDDQLEAHLAAHPDRFVRPARTRLELVFFARARRGELTESDARAVALPEGAQSVGEAYRLGDPQMHLRPIQVISDEAIEHRFGAEVAEAASRLEPGRWSEPVETKVGFYRLRVLERTAPETPPLHEVRGAVQADLMKVRRADALSAGVARLLRDADFEVVPR